MKITQEIYEDLFKTALFINYQNEDRAAECVNHVLLNIHKFNSELSQFNTWSTQLIKNKKIDLWRSNMDKDEVILLTDNYNAIEQIQTTIDPTEDLLKKIKEKLSPSDFDWAVNYISTIRTEEKKTNKEKLRFNQIKAKVLKPNKNPPFIITDIISGQERSFFSMSEIAQLLNISQEYVRLIIRKKSIYKKKYRIKECQN